MESDVLLMLSNLEILNIRLDGLKETYGVTDNIELCLGTNEEGEKLGCRGRVVGNKVYIFEGNLDEALEILNHEFMEFVIAPMTDEFNKVQSTDRKLFNEMSRAFSNVYIELANRVTYESKEKAIDNLVKGLPKELKRVTES
uniref:Uncharacterized protein n=1 Tax=uncultured marine thaumarchaeote KM3_06_C02 TaxID=1455976 RepID=A0A075G4Y4_9ARCH|nr:hypothetical protein [uncultured marine thaumarchaeote KM3_06_C02]